MAEKPTFGKEVKVKIVTPTDEAVDSEFDTRELISHLFPAFFSSFIDIEEVKYDALSSAYVFNSKASSINLDYSIHTSYDTLRLQYIAVGKNDKLFSFMRNPRLEAGKEVYDEHFHMNLLEGDNFVVPAEQRVMARYRGTNGNNQEVTAINDLQAFSAGLRILQEMQTIFPVSITNLKQ